MTDTTTLAPTDDLQKRCAEIIGWHRTGVLVGDTLRSHAESKWPGDIHNLQMAERATENEALCFIAKWGAPAPASDQWRRLFGDVAELVKCLPSSFPDANGHVFKKLRALVEQAPSDGADMPEHWSVVVNIGGKDDPLLTIGHNWLSGAREPTEADTQAIIGAAQHLLAFVGYGLPPTSFDPDEAAPPAQEERVPLTSEQQRCIAEAHSVAACEEYFAARPQIDFTANRRIFEAGFSKGYGITAAQKETP